MDKLDLTQPLEAVHRDTGAVTLVSKRQSTEHGVFFISPMLEDRWYCFELNGRHVFDECPWFIRNADLTAKPSTPSNEELTQRMEKLVRQVASIDEWAGSMACVDAAILDARRIVSDLPKPVGPIDRDLIEARECVAQVYEAANLKARADATRAGLLDNSMRVRIARVAVARGRTLAAGGTAHE